MQQGCVAISDAAVCRAPINVAAVEELPYNAFSLVPCQSPIGGALILCSDAVLYFNQTVMQGVGLNCFASLHESHACDLIDHSFAPNSGIVIDGADHHAAPINRSIAVLTCSWCRRLRCGAEHGACGDLGS